MTKEFYSVKVLEPPVAYTNGRDTEKKYSYLAILEIDGKRQSVYMKSGDFFKNGDYSETLMIPSRDLALKTLPGGMIIMTYEPATALVPVQKNHYRDLFLSRVSPREEPLFTFQNVRLSFNHSAGIVPSGSRRILTATVNYVDETVLNTEFLRPGKATGRQEMIEELLALFREKAFVVLSTCAPKGPDVLIPRLQIMWAERLHEGQAPVFFAIDPRPACQINGTGESKMLLSRSISLRPKDPDPCAQCTCDEGMA